jgi:HEAT repeat protein
LSRLGILTVDAGLVVRGWDAWIAASTGIPATAAVGRPLVEVAPDLVERGLLTRFAQVLSSGEVQVLAPAFHHYLLACAPAAPSPHFDRMQQRVTLGPLKDGDRIAGVMAAIEDVTARMDRERTLTAALRSGDWQARRAAIAALSRHTDDDLARTLIETLRQEHRDFNVLSSALQLLAASDVDVTGPLATLLREPDADLRVQAALALGDHHTPDAIEALMRALDDPDANVRFHAIESLGRLRAGDAVDALVRIATGDDFFLVFPAVDALARISAARAAPALVPLLAHAAIVEPVAEALGELGGAEVVRPLVERLNSGGPPPALARALSRLHARYEERYGGGALIVDEFQAAVSPGGARAVLDAVSSCGRDDLRALVGVLGWLRGDAVHRALARLLGQAEVRADVLEAIARQDAAITAVLVEQLDADDPDTRLAAIVALGRLGDRRAAPAVARLLDGPRAIAVAAAAALARIGDPASHAALLRLLAHPDAAVRQAAIGALNSLGHPSLAGDVLALLGADDATLRESGVRIAGYFGYPEAADALLARATDPVENVRRAAVEHLPYLDDPRAAGALAAAVRDGSAKVRAAAAQALARLPAAAAEPPLLAASADVDSWVRYHAVRGLGEHRAAGARLLTIAESDPAMHVRIAAIEALGALGGGDTADMLLSLAAGRDEDLAAAAVRSLGRSNDARAGGALRAALRAPAPAVRLAAVTAFQSRGSGDGVAALQWTAVADGDDTVAMAAVEALAALARRATADGAAAVDALLASTAEPRVREAAVAALSRLPEVRIDAVAAGLSHAQPPVRIATVAALARMRHPDASAAIRSALDDHDAAVRESAVVALDRLGARGIGRKLAQMARQDPSRAVRRAAAAAMRVDEDAPEPRR